MGENNLSKLTKACLLGIFTFDISKSTSFDMPHSNRFVFRNANKIYSNDALSNKKQTIEDTLPKIP